VLKIRSIKDFFAGLMFVAFGSAAMWMAQAYPFGNASRMGPAYFPTLVGGLLIILGAFVVIRGLAIHGKKPGSFHFKPLILILSSIVLFGLALERLGLIIAIFTLVVFSSLGGNEFRARGVFFLAATLAAGSFLVFIYGLGLQIPSWPFSY
jgi:hypothetical protein